MNGNQPGTAPRAGTHDAPYDEAAAERWVPEPDKRPGRTAFQRDRARVLHSAALRRLAGKTQVVDPGVAMPEINTSPRTRLTHSLECAQVGRELGAALGCDPDLVETACLAHDLGHPPFGHNGEQALAEVAGDCGGFEGNAQSLRLLTRIEPKRFTTDAAGAGGQRRPQPDPGRPGRGHQVPLAARRAPHRRRTPRKFGVYEDDVPVFGWLRAGAPDGRQCFEAQVMDWADDVAYSVHDVEDGLHAGHLDPNLLFAEPERAEIYAVAVGRYAPGADPRSWPRPSTGCSARSGGRTATTAPRSPRPASRTPPPSSSAASAWPPSSPPGTPTAPGRLTRYAARLVVPAAVRLECAVLKAVADRYVMQRADQARRRADQRVVIAELAEALTGPGPGGAGAGVPRHCTRPPPTTGPGCGSSSTRSPR